MVVSDSDDDVVLWLFWTVMMMLYCGCCRYNGDDDGREKGGGIEVVLYTFQLMMQLCKDVPSMHVSLVKLLQVSVT